jgi:hypothetical protein
VPGRAASRHRSTDPEGVKKLRGRYGILPGFLAGLEPAVP